MFVAPFCPQVFFWPAEKMPEVVQKHFKSCGKKPNWVLFAIVVQLRWCNLPIEKIASHLGIESSPSFGMTLSKLFETTT